MEEGKVNGEKMIVTDQDAAELTEPCVIRSIFHRRL